MRLFCSLKLDISKSDFHTLCGILHFVNLKNGGYLCLSAHPECRILSHHLMAKLTDTFAYFGAKSTECKWSVRTFG